MSSRRIWLVLAGVIVLVILVGPAKRLFFEQSVSFDGPATAVKPTATVLPGYEARFVIAIQPISRGTKITAEMVGVRPFMGSVPATTLTDVFESIGHIAKIDITQGQLILPTMLLEP
jgi:flagella basal body P-ring formation protein FlgA